MALYLVVGRPYVLSHRPMQHLDRLKGILEAHSPLVEAWLG
jgi:hypothetical protein